MKGSHLIESSGRRIVKGACHHDCPDTCVWNVTVEDGAAVRLRGDPDHPTTRGQLCPKVNRFLDRVYDDRRLLTPLRRTGPKGSGTFEPVSWEEALAEIASRLTSVIDSHGSESILQFSFDGTEGVVQKGILADRFFDAIGASDIRRHLCGVTAWLGAAEVSGVPFGIDPEDIRHAKTILLWGTNTQLTNRHLSPVVEEAQADGAHVVVIDPIRTATADKADQFLQIRPGTDVALVLGMIDVLVRDGLIDAAWLDTNTSGWEALRDSAVGFSIRRSAEVTGLPASAIEALAHRYVKARPSAIRVLVGPEHREHGQDLMRSIAMLPAVTGAWRDVGGGLARSTQVYFEEALNYPTDRPERREFNMAALGSVLLSDNLDPPIRALVVHNSNPAVICPDQNAVISGLERPDLFTVVIEQFMTDTARYSDIVLPATTQIEHLDLAISWGHLYLALNKPAIAPRGEALPNTEVFRRLAAAMNLDRRDLFDDDETLIRQLLDTDHPWSEGITYERLLTETWCRLTVPAGHRPYVDASPDTDDRLLHLGALSWVPGTETPLGDPDLASEFPLTLMSRKQHAKFLNANYGGFERHYPREGGPQLRISPVDAKARGVREGDVVRVHNRRGRVSLTAVLDADLLDGVVTMPFGWWNDKSPEGRAVNALTNPSVSNGIGSAAFHETLVEVTPVGR